MKIAIANDHRGYKEKFKVIDKLKSKFDFINYGTDDDKRVDYPSFAFKVGESVAKKECAFGILICSTGIGMSIACNKVKGIRCARVSTDIEAYFARAHNNANVLAISSELPIDDIYSIIETFLHTKFLTDNRYHNRVKLIDKYEDGEYNEL